MELAELTYHLMRPFPVDERFGLVTQLRRSAVSAAGNVAEGCGRLHRGDYVHHLSMAAGSLAEAETQMILAVNLAFVMRKNATGWRKLAQETGRLIGGLERSPSS